MQNKDRSFSAIIRYHDPEPVEFLLGVFIFLWGARLLWVGDTFGSSPSFRVMALIAPEDGWGAVMVMVGLLKLVALRVGDHIARAAASFLGTTVWMLIWASISTANPAGTGVVVYSSFVVFSAWVLWRNISETRSRVT
jgi:hypothetical protein